MLHPKPLISLTSLPSRIGLPIHRADEARVCVQERRATDQNPFSSYVEVKGPMCNIFQGIYGRDIE